jgi:hypothetical protein
MIAGFMAVYDGGQSDTAAPPGNDNHDAAGTAVPAATRSDPQRAVPDDPMATAAQ